MQNYLPIIFEWQNIIANVRGLEREYNKQLLAASNSKPIKIVTGFRRCGKSFLVQMVARKLIDEKHIALSNLLYLNFEDYRLADIQNIQSLDKLVQLFLHEIASSGKKLLIFDEIQNVEDWDKLIRTLYEKEQDIEIFLTGSNSELLSSELGSNLAGRYIAIEILPFNFKEFLAYHKISITNNKDFVRHSSDIKKLFSEFQKFGGLPEVFTISNNQAKYSYLQGILSKVILDDIIKRFNVRQPKMLESIIHYLYIGIGNIVSPTRVANFLKNEYAQTKPDTISTYMDYIIKTFAMYEITRFDWKLNRTFDTNKKYYAVDTGIVNLFQAINNNYSKQLENIVFLKLKNDYQSVYYGALENGKEIDFIAKDASEKFYKFQVAKTLTNENRTRELSSFSLSDKHLHQMKNILLTLDEEEELLTTDHCTIEKKYLLKWLLDI